MREANYKQIATTYDAARELSKQNLEFWIRLISGKIGPRQEVELLDLGCGTRRFSIPIATRLGYSVTGADKSEEMLRKARRKSGGAQVKWDIQDATTLSYSD